MNEHVHYCPICDGHGEHLGGLGHLDHYRCRQCGMNFSKERDDD
jgi:transposase-like protein